MKKTVFICTMAMTGAACYGQHNHDRDHAVTNAYTEAFDAAYRLNPDIPRGVLEAVAYTNTRFYHLDPASQTPACTGLPPSYGVMGLMMDGKNVFRNNLQMTAELSGYETADIIAGPDASIMAYAKAYSVLKKQLNIAGAAIEDQYTVLAAMSEIPSGDPTGNFALNSNLYTMYAFLDDPAFQLQFGFPAYQVDFAGVFGEENYRVLSSSRITVSENGIRNKKGDTFTPVPFGPDYPNSIWDPAASCNYSVGRSQSVSAVAIHTMQGTYGSTLYWFKDCASNVSTQYIMRSSDGQITQMVLEANTAQHVATENPYTIGIEHEGYIDNPAWYTTAMYNASAALVKDICDAGYGISPLSAWYGSACSGNVNQCLVDQCIRIKGHQMFPNGGHTDPGPNWDWRRYYHLLNDKPLITKVTTASGTLYDSGGPSGSYKNLERPMTLIRPANAESITLTFKNFELEADADHLLIYDGDTTTAPLIGTYTGANSPGTVTSSGRALLIEFRSDCSQVFAGWEADWTSVQADVTAPTTSISGPASWVTADFPVAFSDADNAGGSGLNKSLYHVVAYDGSQWRANNSRGFFRDNFSSSLHADWTTHSGSWNTASGVLTQSDESLSNSSLSAPLVQNLSNRYLFAWSASIAGAGTNRRAGLHFFCDDPAAPNRGNSYLVWFRADQQLVEIYKSVNDVLGAPLLSAPVAISAGTWYDFKVSFDRSTGKMAVYMDNAIVASWTDASPLAGGSSVSFRSGNALLSVDDFNVYRSRGASVTVTVGTAASDDIAFQSQSPSQSAALIKSIVVDNAGNLSSVASQGVKVDWTAPDAVQVSDGTAADIDLTLNPSQLSANWTASADAHSGVAAYHYTIGTAPRDSDVVAWTANGLNTAFTHGNLSLAPGTTYYVAVKAGNAAGLFSNVTVSDGQRFEVTTALEENASSARLAAYPNPAREIVTITGSAPAGGGRAVVEITGVSGKVICTAEAAYTAGSAWQATWNLRNTGGSRVAPGLYLARLVREGATAGPAVRIAVY